MNFSEMWDLIEQQPQVPQQPVQPQQQPMQQMQPPPPPPQTGQSRRRIYYAIQDVLAKGGMDPRSFDARVLDMPHFVQNAGGLNKQQLMQLGIIRQKPGSQSVQLMTPDGQVAIRKPPPIVPQQNVRQQGNVSF